MELLAHLRVHALCTDGPFTLRSGAVSEWYVDARQTTFDGAGARLAGEAVLSLIAGDVVAVGGMTMGADPIAVATALVGGDAGRPLRAFSVRKEAKGHGTGGRVVGQVGTGDVVAVLEDTTTTGETLLEAATVLQSAGAVVRQAIAIVDRSDGAAAHLLAQHGVLLHSLFTPMDLGVT